MFDPDPDMSPSSLTRDQLYHFITDRFQSPAPACVQEQALQWLQILCLIEIYIPVPLLVQMFMTGVNSLQKLESRAQRREYYTMAGSSSNEQSIDNGLNLMLSQDDGTTTNPTSGIAGLTTSSSLPSANKFLVFDTYETYRAHRHQLMLQQMTGQEMVSIIKEEEEEFIINESEINSTCCTMMIDMILKQVNFCLSFVFFFMSVLDGNSTNSTAPRNVQSFIKRNPITNEYAINITLDTSSSLSYIIKSVFIL